MIIAWRQYLEIIHHSIFLLSPGNTVTFPLHSFMFHTDIANFLCVSLQAKVSESSCLKVESGRRAFIDKLGCSQSGNSKSVSKSYSKTDIQRLLTERPIATPEHTEFWPGTSTLTSWSIWGQVAVQLARWSCRLNLISTGTETGI